MENDIVTVDDLRAILKSADPRLLDYQGRILDAYREMVEEAREAAVLAPGKHTDDDYETEEEAPTGSHRKASVSRRSFEDKMSVPKAFDASEAEPYLDIVREDVFHGRPVDMQGFLKARLLKTAIEFLRKAYPEVQDNGAFMLRHNNILTYYVPHELRPDFVAYLLRNVDGLRAVQRASEKEAKKAGGKRKPGRPPGGGGKVTASKKRALIESSEDEGEFSPDNMRSGLASDEDDDDTSD